MVLRDLRRLGLVESVKGNRGGYRLLRPAEEINLLDLYRSLAGGDGNGLHQDNTPPRSPADAWLQNLAERWGRIWSCCRWWISAASPDRPARRLATRASRSIA